MINKMIIGSIAFLVGSQAYAWDKMEGVAKAEAKGVVSITSQWIKDKKDKYDVQMKFTSMAPKTILMFVGDIKCGRGTDMSGTVDIHSDNRKIDLRNGEVRDITLTCRLGKDLDGDFVVTAKVFENPTGDSQTPGKVLVEKLTWKQGEKEGKVL